MECSKVYPYGSKALFFEPREIIDFEPILLSYPIIVVTEYVYPSPQQAPARNFSRGGLLVYT